MPRFEVDIKQVHDVTVGIQTDLRGLGYGDEDVPRDSNGQMIPFFSDPENPTRTELEEAAQWVNDHFSCDNIEYNRTMIRSLWTIRDSENNDFVA